MKPMTPRNPRVTFVIEDLSHGGSQRQLWLMASALAGRAEVHVVVMSSLIHPYADRIAETGARVTVLSRRSGLEPGRLRRLTGSIRDAHSDVVHGILDSSNGYAFVAGRYLRIPVVMSLRSDRLQVAGARARVLSAMFRHADGVTVNSEAGRSFLETRIRVPYSRLVHVPNIVAVSATGVRPAPAGDPVVGCVGRLAEVKRFDTVIAAMPVVRERVPGARLVVVGEGPCRGALEAAARAGNVDAQFVGAVDDASRAAAGFSVLVVASHYEGVSNSALEALALGVPVVTVSAGDMAGVIEDGVTGIVARNASPSALGDAIARAITNGALQESSSREGPRVVRERFSAEHARDLLLDVYRRVTTKSGAIIHR